MNKKDKLNLAALRFACKSANGHFIRQQIVNIMTARHIAAIGKK